MAYEVLARKWRPRQFDDVVGQSHVTQTLRNAITSKRIAHAYLFVGPRGIGKTSMARIFAKALNCATGPTVTPCDKCDACREIAAGTSLDVMEIDGASNNGVEQVRELRDTVKYAPTHGTYKIYIIDEVHMLTTAAFNALLKTLEEPPPHVKFIFATTEPEKILATILSRCQRFDLRRIPVGLIVDRLKNIASVEKIKIDPDALLAVARGCEGGLRDAVSALDQLVSFKGADIKEDDVLSVFGLASRSMLEEMAGSIIKGDVKKVIELAASLDGAGKDLQRFVLELMGHFRNLLVWMYVKDASGMDLIDTQVECLKLQASMTNHERVIRISDILGETENRMKYALSKLTLFETALIKCSRAATVVSIDEVIRQINALKAGGGVETVHGGSMQDDSVSKTSYVDASMKVHVQPAVKAPDSDAYGNDEMDLLKSSWREVLDKVGKMAVGSKSLLLDARPTCVDGNKVTVGFDPEFADSIEKFDIPRNRKALEHVLGVLLKRSVTVELKAAVQGKEERAEGGSGITTRKLVPPPAIAKGQAKTKRDLIDDPTVQKALDIFDGTVMDVRE
ncbi:MAG: DNA polymerase III, subunit gamma and tau [Lentisphaerae bacterium RIFOXYA12_FULL_48_11]|nr:MAG: DNA polymerase III, subunit gamma and tau [Lentisphaerae bacterium RIFOXYA12_FULL_48_11]